jgi:hypothetical protein
MITFLILVFILIIILASVRPSEVISRWHHHFDEFQFSSEEFYKAVEHGIKRREVPHALVGTNTFFEGSVVSHRRAYFKVSNGGYTFDICAAPYGKSFFVSWWLRESKSAIELLFARFFPFANQKTYYQLDTESMFRESIHHAVLEAIDAMTKEKGIRGPSELERQIVANPKFTFKV